jgi:hypothetical protein
MLFATPQFAIFGYVGAFRSAGIPSVRHLGVDLAGHHEDREFGSNQKQVEGSSRSRSSRTRPRRSGRRTRPFACTRRS